MPPKSREKNPLSSVFGRSIRELRNGLGLTVSRVGPELGLSEDSLRRIESGRDPLHPKYALRLTRALVDSQLNWGCVVQVLAAIHDVEENGKSEEGIYDLQYLRSMIEELGNYDLALRDALRPIVAISPNDEKDLFRAAVRRLKTHLTQTHFTDADPTAFGQLPPGLSAALAQIGRISPVYVDIVIDQLRRLAAFQPVIDKAGLADWEAANARRFKSVFGVTRAPNVFRDSVRNLFDWSYIWRENFDGIFVLVMNDSSDCATLEREIHDALLDRARRRPGESVDARYRATLERKMRVKSYKGLEPALARKLEEVLQPHGSVGAVYHPTLKHPGPRKQPSRKSEPQFSNAWFFRMDQPAYILGYVDNVESVDVAGSAQVLGWSESVTYITQLEEAWATELNDVIASREKL